jgi:hypothetical protein
VITPTDEAIYARWDSVCTLVYDMVHRAGVDPHVLDDVEELPARAYESPEALLMRRVATKIVPAVFDWTITPVFGGTCYLTLQGLKDDVRLDPGLDTPSG